MTPEEEDAQANYARWAFEQKNNPNPQPVRRPANSGARHVSRYPEHYCGKAHDPRQECPQPGWLPGGVELNRVRAAAPCTCPADANWHSENCPRRKVIEMLEHRRNRGH